MKPMFQSQEAADVGATVSVSLAATSWMAPLTEVVTLLAAAVAIWAGVGSGLYYFESWRQKRRDR
jgi:hypothetical protein